MLLSRRGDPSQALKDMYIFREAYREGRSVQDLRQRLADSRSKILSLDMENEYRLHDMKPVLVSLPLDFGKYVNRGIQTASSYNDDLPTDSSIKEELGDSDKEQSHKEKNAEVELEVGEGQPTYEKKAEEFREDNNKEDNIQKKDWVFDDYIVEADGIDWETFDDETKYKKLLGIVNKSREVLNRKVNTQAWLMEDTATCAWCFKHWHGREPRSLCLPKTVHGLKQWIAVFL